MNVHCVKCGMEASAKCPHCRNVFPEYEKSPNGAMHQALEWRFVYFHSEGTKHTIRFNGDAGETDEQTLRRFLESASTLTEKQREQLCCVHNWQFKPGEKSTIGCGH
jgi:hypothetical protein